MKRIFASVLLCAMLFTTLAIGGAGNVATPSVLDADTYPQVSTMIGNVNGEGEVEISIGADMSKATKPSAITGYTGRVTLSNADTYDGSFNTGNSTKDTENANAAFDLLYNNKVNNEITLKTAEDFVSFLHALNRVKIVAKGANPLSSTATNMPYYDFKDVTVKLAADIEINAVDANGNLTQKRAMPQIAGNLTRYFIGTFDGDGHVVSGWYQAATSNNRSMFGPLYGATIQNVAFINCYFDAYNEAHEKVGDDTPQKTSSMLSVFTYGKTTLSSVYVEGKHDGGKTHLGGLVGRITSGAELEVKNSAVNITYGAGGHNPAEKFIGGMIGTVEKNAKLKIDNCEVTCALVANNGGTIATAYSGTVIDIDGTEGVDPAVSGTTGAATRYKYAVAQDEISLHNAFGYGGVVGVSLGSISVKNCRANGTIDAVGFGIGGIVGYLDSNQTDTIEFNNCENNIDITIGDTIYLPFASETKTENKDASGKVTSTDYGRAYYINIGTETEPNYVPAYRTGVKGVKMKDDAYTGLAQNESIGTMYIGSCVGGILGGLWGSSAKVAATLTTCVNNGDINAFHYVGGIVGQKQCARESTFDSCVNTGNIVASNEYSGGIIGYKGSSCAINVRYCANSGIIKAKNQAGGIFGRLQQGGLNLENCINTANITATGGARAGGIFGSANSSKNQDGKEINVSYATNTGIIQGAGYVGGIMGQRDYGDTTAADVTLEYCLNTGAINSTGDGFGGMIGDLSYHNSATSPKILINYCENRGTVTGTKKAYGGGMVGRHQGSDQLTIQNCTNTETATISSTNQGYLGGILGYNALHTDVKTATKQVVIIDGCANYANVTGSAQLGGMVGSSVKGDLEIKNSLNAGDITCSSNQAAGIIGRFNAVGYGLSVDNCVNKGAISCSTLANTTNKGQQIGGIGGYLYGDDANFVKYVHVTNSRNVGTVTGNRCSGGIVAQIQDVAEVKIINCIQDGTLTFLLKEDTSNPYAGGLIGLFAESGDLTVSKCVVAGTVTAKHIDTNRNYYVGGVVGYIRRGNDPIDYAAQNVTADYPDCIFEDITIAIDQMTKETNAKKTLNFNAVAGGNGATNVPLLNADGSINKANGRIVPAYDRITIISDTVTVTKNEKGTDITKVEGAEIGIDSALYDSNDYVSFTNVHQEIRKIGAQYQKNEDGSYNLRYVFGADRLESTDKVFGFNLGAYDFSNGSDTPAGSSKTVYCPYVYKTLNGGDVVYHAEDYGVDYFFTLEIGNIKAEALDLTGERPYLKNVHLNIEAFINDANEKQVVSLQHTDSVLWNNNQKFYYNNFSAEKPTKFTDEGLIEDYKWTTDGSLVGSVADKKTNEVLGCLTAYRGSATTAYLAHTGEKNHTCGNFVAHGVTALRDGDIARFHYYLDAANHKTAFGSTPTRAEMMLQIKVDTTQLGGGGTYDFCFQLRLKDNTSRHIRVEINNQPYDEQAILTYKPVKYTNVIASDKKADATYQDSYLTGFSAKLDNGVNTITFRLPYNANEINAASCWHFRNIFVAKQQNN